MQPKIKPPTKAMIRDEQLRQRKHKAQQRRWRNAIKKMKPQDREDLLVNIFLHPLLRAIIQIYCAIK